MTGPAAGAARRHFLDRRRRALSWASLTVVALGALTLLLLAPNRLASLRLGEVALAWWALGVVALVALVAVSRGVRAGDPIDTAADRASPLVLALVWGSPALWLGLPPLILGDGIHGLWPAAVVMGGAVVALLLLGPPPTRVARPLASGSRALETRWPSAVGCRMLLGSIEALVAALFVWAQLATVRELGTIVGWPRASTIGAVVVVALAALVLPDPFRVRLVAVGGGLALLGLAVPLALVAANTTASWPGVWSAVASRPRIAFIEGTSWTVRGGAVRGPDEPAAMRFADDQRIAFASPGTVILELGDGKRLAQRVQIGTELPLHPGDRLIVPDGMRLRFEPGRRVPDAPDSGPAWIEPPSRDTGWLSLVAMGLTGVLGALGLPVGAIHGRAGTLPRRRGAQLTVGVVMVGAALAVGWSLYAVWLTPEVYAGGVTGAEVYALPASVARLGSWGGLLAGFALGGLVVGSVAAALAGLLGVAGSKDPVFVGRDRYGAALVLLGAGLLAALAPAAPWTLLVLALGVAASALAPAVALACWSERATPGGLVAAAVAGLVVFVVVSLAGVVSPAGPEDEWRAAIAAGPAAVAVPVHLLVAWLLRSRRSAAPRLSSGLQGLSTAPPPAD